MHENCPLKSYSWSTGTQYYLSFPLFPLVMGFHFWLYRKLIIPKASKNSFEVNSGWPLTCVSLRNKMDELPCEVSQTSYQFLFHSRANKLLLTVSENLNL